MKILYVTTISNTINAFLIPHIEWLLNEGHTVDIASNIVSDVDPKLISLGCKVFNIDFQRSPLKLDNLKAYKKIKTIIETEKYDVVHTHTPVASFITRLACKNNKDLKVLYTAHGFHFYKGAPLKNHILFYPIEKIAAKYTDIIITMNEEDFNVANKFKMKNKLCVYKTHGVGLNLSEFKVYREKNKALIRQRYGYKESDFILFYAAELNDNKNQIFLIDLVSRLVNDIPNIKLLLAGRGPNKEKYLKLISARGLEKNIELLGFRNDIPQLLKLSDILVASSKREGLPVNIMEAMAIGLPVVASKIRGHIDLIKNEKNGYVIDLDNVDLFVEKIKFMYENPVQYQKISKNNISDVEIYEIDKVIKEINTIYKYLS